MNSAVSSTGWSLYIITEWWRQGKRLHGKYSWTRIFNFSWILSAGWATEVWYLGGKRVTFSHPRKIQTLSVRKLYTHQPMCVYIALGLLELNSNSFGTSFYSQLTGCILVLWHCVCASVQFLLFNTWSRLKKVHPGVNMRQCKGFELQLTNVVLFFAGNWVAANLSVLNGSKIPLKGKRTDDNKLRTTCSLNQISTSSITQKMWECHFYFILLLFLFHISRESNPNTKWNRLCLFTYIFSMSCFSSIAVGRSLLLPRTKTSTQRKKKPWNCSKQLFLQLAQVLFNRCSIHTKHTHTLTNSFGSTLTGIPCNCGLSSKLWSSFLDASTFSWSAASTI